MFGLSSMDVSKDEPVFTDRVLVLGDNDIIKSAENLDISEIEVYHIKRTPKYFYRANLVVLNVTRNGRIQTKVMKNRWGHSGVVSTNENW